MGVVVVMAWAAVGNPLSPAVLEAASGPLILLGITTAFSRMAMFTAVQVFGSLRTAILAVAEIGVALALAFLVLNDRMTAAQWIGVGLLVSSLLLMRPRDLTPHGFKLSALLVRDVASIQFQRIAFHRAFGKREHDNESSVMSQITTSEMQAIRRMMGAKDSPVDPFPLPRNTYFNATVDLTKFLDGVESQESGETPEPDQG
jgi:hypothetical protein